jgi:hypothetical protein
LRRVRLSGLHELLKIEAELLSEPLHVEFDPILAGRELGAELRRKAHVHERPRYDQLHVHAGAGDGGREVHVAALALGVELALARRLHRLARALRGALEGSLVGRDVLRLLNRCGDVGRRRDGPGLHGLCSSTRGRHGCGKANEEKSGRASHQ